MGRAFDVLVVDDDPGQVALLASLIDDLKLPHRLHFAPNGHSALDFLYRRGVFELAPRPHLILLDVNMPGMNGFGVLRAIKADETLRSIPVIMLSTSRAALDVSTSYAEHANAYVQKPGDLDSNLLFVKQLDEFWAESVLLPD